MSTNESDDRRRRLRDLLAEQALITGGEIRLASGRTSSLYFNVKRPLFAPEAAAAIADMLLDRLAALPVDRVGGMALGAVPIVAAVCARSWPDRPIEGFFVRKEMKEHGTGSRIEGLFAAGDRAVLLEDVTTSGGSTLQAARTVREAGGIVEHAITVIDRQEGATEALAAEGITLHALFRRDDFIP